MSIIIVISSISLYVFFQRVLIDQNLINWYNLVAPIAHIDLDDKNDILDGIYLNGQFVICI